MKGILFKENLFKQVIAGNKTQTRRMNKTFKKGDIVYLKEPYAVCNDLLIYKYLSKNTNNIRQWKNKLFMPEKFARYFIKITDVKEQYLHDITEQEAIKECIEVIEGLGYMNYIYPSRLYFDIDKLYKVDSFKKEYAGAVMSFLSLWEKINKVNVFEQNPKVYVCEFELVK
jgi:hypothetical protein